MAQFKLTSLADLLSRMEDARVDRCHFRFQLHAGDFDVFFFADTSPFVLGFGAIGRNFYFELEVDPKTFETPGVFVKDVYYKLCEILGLRRDPANPFTPSVFLQRVNMAIVGVAFRKTTPRDLSRYRRDVEEADKIWFCGWRDNTSEGKHVTSMNLIKTRRWLGEQAYLRCKEKNISSRWTDDKTKAKELWLP